MSDNSQSYGQMVDNDGQQRSEEGANMDDDNNNIQPQQYQQKQQQLIQHQQYADNNSNDEQLLLSKTLQRPQNLQPQSLINQYQQPHVKTNNLYVKNQHGRINQDLGDLHSLQQEIQRLQQIKTQYKTQKQSIEKLGQVVEKLKSQNKQLKKGSIKNDNQQINYQQLKRQNAKNIKKQIQIQDKNNLTLPNNQQQKQTKQVQNSRVSFNSGNKVVGEFINRKQQQKSQSRNNLFSNMKQQQLQRSPRYRMASNTSQSFYLSRQYPLNLNNQFDSYLTPSADNIVRNHVTNKHSIISNFVDELKLQLQQNEMVLQQQKRLHRQTRQKLQNCLQQLRLLHLRLEQNKNVDAMQRQCVRLKQQLQTEVSQRLLVEQRFRQRQLLLIQNQTRRIKTYQQFDRQLDQMDQIYFNMEATLKL